MSFNKWYSLVCMQFTFLFVWFSFVSSKHSLSYFRVKALALILFILKHMEYNNIILCLISTLFSRHVKFIALTKTLPNKIIIWKYFMLLINVSEIKRLVHMDSSFIMMRIFSSLLNPSHLVQLVTSIVLIYIHMVSLQKYRKYSVCAWAQRKNSLKDIK